MRRQEIRHTSHRSRAFVQPSVRSQLLLTYKNTNFTWLMLVVSVPFGADGGNLYFCIQFSCSLNLVFHMQTIDVTQEDLASEDFQGARSFPPGLQTWQ